MIYITRDMIKEKIKNLFKDKSIYNTKNLHDYLSDYSYKIDDTTYDNLLLHEFSNKYNKSKTTCGDELFNHFLRGTRSETQVKNFQNDLKNLSIEDAEKIKKILSKIGKQKRGFVVSDLWEGFTIKSRIIDNFYILFLLNIIISSAIFFLSNKTIFFALLFFFIFNFILYLATNNKISRVIGSINYIRVLCNALNKIEKKTSLSISETSPAYKKFNTLNYYAVFFKDGIGGPESGDILSVIIDYLRSFLCFEIFAFKMTSGFIIKNLDEIHKIIFYAGYLDLLVNINSVIDENKTCYASFTEDKKISFTNMNHPLLEKSVAQNKQITDGLIITGLNMSGKTTFMKTLATNQLLATSFGIAFAENFSTSIYKILTSFAINDDLLKGKSRYYAEAYRLLEIKNQLELQNTICFVDEILSGTNSHDRIYGAVKILEDFTRFKNSIVIAATHDNQIAESLSSKLAPVYFDGEVSGDQINFDYLIKDGIVSNRNGLLILKLIGLE